MNSPLVSILITTYNCKEILSPTLQSLLGQSYPSIEIIVVEDGSTDGTAELLAELTEQYQSIHAYYPGRLGRAKALNYGLSKCQGKYVAINDADDFSRPSRIEKQVAYLENTPEVGLLGTGKEVKEGTKKWVTPVLTRDDEIRKFFAKGQPIQHSTVMFRKVLLDQIGGYNEKIPFLLDRDIFIRMAKITKLHQLSEPLILLNRSNQQYFKNKYTGLHRSWMSTKYQLKAITAFGFSPLLKLEVIAKFIYHISLETWKNLKHR